MTKLTHAQDSRLLGHLFSTEAMKEVFCDETTLARWLEVEAQLALVQARYGVMPEAAAAAIHKACSVEHYDLAELGKAIAAASHSLTPVIKAIEQMVGEYGQYVHFGATTQDIMDTGMVLQVRAGLDLLIASHRLLITHCLAHARRWRDLPMAGRTHGQHAVPITLGLKFALWAEETSRSLDQLMSLKAGLAVQFAGAAGTLATLASVATQVREGLADNLGLADPGGSWHTARDHLARIISQLAISAATCGKIANEVVNLQRTEIDELSEGAKPDAGGSSTMPQKRNPMMAQNIVALARLMATRPSAMFEAMMHEHERDMAAWTMEWAIIPESFVYAHAAVEQTARLVEHLQVNTANIKRNLAATGGAICSEAVMMDLAGDLGRNTAHHLLAEIAQTAASSGQSFANVLYDHPQIAGIRSREQIEGLLDPANYLGQAREITDRILRELE